MEKKIKAAVIVLGNNIDTDQIYPGRYLDITDHAQMGKLCLSGVDENIAPNFKKDGIVVAGSNFGCGSSRENAATAILNMGASCVLADSFARIFFRNCINLGVPLITCKGINKAVADGDEVEVDMENGKVTVIATGAVLDCDKIDGYAMSILEAGGIKPLYLKKNAER